MKQRKIHQGFFSPLSLGEGQGVRLLLSVLFFCSCGDSSNSKDIPLGTSVQVKEDIQVSILPIAALDVPDAPATRAEKTDTSALQVTYAPVAMPRADINKTTAEKEVKTAYVVQFDGTSPTSKAVWVSGDMAAQLNSGSQIPCSFELTSGVKSRVYVVANPKNVPALGTTLQSFETVSYIVSTLPGTGLPMVASQDVALGGVFSTFQLKSPLARLTFTTNTGSLTLRGIPSSYSLVPATAGTAAVRPSGVTYTSTSLTSGTTYYVPANLSGQVSLSSPILRCSLFAPTNSMYVAINANSTTYNVYLGDSSNSDFNVVSNFAYTVGATVGGTDGVDLRVNTPISITALDGSGTANCYIATSANTWYSFSATVMGNGKSTPSITPTALAPTSSDVLWETWNTLMPYPLKGDVVKATYIVNDRILFSTSNNEGNAVIAARDAGNNIIWSWHIWYSKVVPASVPLSTITNNLGFSVSGLMMMDRNLGAMSATTRDNLSIGLLYQWGRKDPFPGFAGYYPYDDVIVTQPYGIHTYSTPLKQYTVIQSIAQPTTFFGFNGDWCSTRNDNLWGTPLADIVNINGQNYNSNKGSKSIYDPCPVGWRVPPDYSWANATTTNCVWDVWGSDFGKITTSNSIKFWFPAYGARNYDGLLDTFGSSGCYWTSSPSATNTSNGSNLYFFSSITPGSNRKRAFGNSVRCVKE